MGRRKGELTSAGIDRGWPHQIALLSSECEGENHDPVRTFADALSACTRGHKFFHNDKWHRVFCFAEKTDAEKFQAKFGGEWFDPARRGRGKRWHLLREPKQRFY
jgi:hypothetical protein